MPKLKLTFRLPEEAIEAQTALDGEKWKGVVWDLNEEIRTKLKHGELTGAESDVYEKIRNSIFEKLQENGLSFD